MEGRTTLNSTVVYECNVCTTRYPVSLERIVCDCGGVLDLAGSSPSFRTWTNRDGIGLARFADQIPVPESLLARSSLGLSMTPLLKVDDSLFAKCDFVSPSGSFKDRGAQVLAALALDLDVRHIVLDSSGNAAAAMAAHAARVGLKCSVVVPSSAPSQKLRQVRAYGARVITREGPRIAATEYAFQLAEESKAFFASHVENPFFFEGTKTWAFEVAEQLGDAPDEVVMAVGNGSLFIGAYRGFVTLFDQGITSRVPRMVAAQVKGWSPLSGDIGHGDEPPLADGIAIIRPRRLKQILEIIDQSSGEVRTVPKHNILEATQSLARRGLWVEPTSATAWAAGQGGERDAIRTVVSLGGAGFKSSVDIAQQ